MFRNCWLERNKQEIIHKNTTKQKKINNLKEEKEKEKRKNHEEFRIYLSQLPHKLLEVLYGTEK